MLANKARLYINLTQTVAARTKVAIKRKRPGREAEMKYYKKKGKNRKLVETKGRGKLHESTRRKICNKKQIERKRG